MERKQEEQARQMQELQVRIKSLQRDNDQLRSQVEKSLKLGKDVREGDCAERPIIRNKEKDPIISNDGDAPTDN